MARKTKYDPETFPKWVEDFARQGLSDKQISANLGISFDSYYKYIKRYPEFAEAIKRGKAPVDMEVENALNKSATGYFVEEYDIKVLEDGTEKKVNRRQRWIPPNVTAAIFWLKNRRPSQWRDKVEQDVNLKGDLTVKFDKEDKDL